jgi:hypothetical protein
MGAKLLNFQSPKKGLVSGWFWLPWGCIVGLVLGWG